MSTITFDTLKFAQRLEKAGLPAQQASAFAEAQKEALSEALDTQVATKADIADVKADMRLMEQRLQHQINLIKWMLALVIVTSVIPVLKAVFG
jgi:uncharacterized membrane-anchored protein